MRWQYARPAVWAPRPAELVNHGRADLKQAMDRFGGATRIYKVAGLVPYREWYYFEGQLELLEELRRYLDEFADSDYSEFPTVSEVERNGYTQLHALIQYYGGRKFLEARLGMVKKGEGIRKLDWGPFDLDFGVRLLQLVREDQLKKNPPMQYQAIVMPSTRKLLSYGKEGQVLEAEVHAFGGRENVARRLGLAI